MAQPKKKTIRYQDAGVSIDEADRAVASIRTMARKTFTSGVLTDIGSFGGGYLLHGPVRVVQLFYLIIVYEGDIMPRCHALLSFRGAISDAAI